MRRIKLPVSDDIIASEYLNDGRSTVYLAKKYGCSATTITHILRAGGVELRAPSEASRAVTQKYEMPKEFLVEEYITNRKTQEEIAAIVGCDRKLVQYRLRKYKIPCRTPGEGHRGRTHVVSPETAKKISENNKGKPNPMKGKRYPPEFGKRVSDAKKGKVSSLVFTDEIRRKISESKKGELNPNWRNGARQQKYCHKFNFKLKERIRDKHDRRCVVCGRAESSRRLDIHHIDFNKMQGCGHEWNLVPVCNKCHGLMGSNRWYWFSLLFCHWAMHPNRNFVVSAGYPLTYLEYS